MFRVLTFFLISTIILMTACDSKTNHSTKMTASKILGNPAYPAISYSGYRETTRDEQPTVEQLKEDMHILSAMGIKILRTYDVRYDHTPNLLKAIHEIRKEDPEFEMYVMVGIWIDCKNAWTDKEPIHSEESDRNAGEVERAVRLAQKYPDIVKVLAVGNEAMIRWAAAYYVEPDIILKWVNYLQKKKADNKLDQDLWITSSDNFASWGGGDTSYHTEELRQLIRAVDFISMHTYPMHDTHYNPAFWGTPESEAHLTEKQKLNEAMERAIQYSKAQYKEVESYIKSLGVNKPIHIGETGWATVSTENYGVNGTKACDEYKSSLYYKKLNNWCNQDSISCFYFEAFDEPWKDAGNPDGSENHFGLFTVDGKAKLSLWEKVDEGVFDGLTRNGNPIRKSYKGTIDSVFTDVAMPPFKEVNVPEKFY